MSSDKKALLLYFDLETTGLSRWNDHITQIGTTCILRPSEGPPRKIGDFEVLVNSGHRIQDSASKKTGITDEMVRKAPSTAEAIQQWTKWLAETREKHDLVTQPATLVAYNGMNFDFPVLLMELHRCNIPSIVFFNTNRIQFFLDPLIWARDSLVTDNLIRNTRGNCSFVLSDLYKSITGKKLENAHTALADTDGLGEVCESTHFADMRHCECTNYCLKSSAFCSDFLQQRRKRTQSGKNCQRQQVRSLISMKRKRMEGTESPKKKMK